MWIRLIDYEAYFVTRGSLLKFPAKWPFEDEVVMMVCEFRGEADFPVCLVTITGHKAGINPLVAFPKECNGGDTEYAPTLSTAWLIENWNKWVWQDGDVKDVLVRRSLEASEI